MILSLYEKLGYKDWELELVRKALECVEVTCAEARAEADKRIDEALKKNLESLGCSTEYEKTHNLLAVSIPETVRLTEVQAYLQSETSAGCIDYEEPIMRQE